MKMFLLFSVLFLSNCKLLSVIQINRHGARTAANFFKGKFNSLMGENMKLTPHGYNQHKILGKIIRDIYINKKHFLDNTFNPIQFEIFSTPMQRTIFSAEGFLSGLYPYNNIKLKYQDENFPLEKNEYSPLYYTNIFSSFFYNSYSNSNYKDIIINVISPKNDFMLHPTKCKFKGEYVQNLIKNSLKEIFNIDKNDVNSCKSDFEKFLNIKINPNTNVTENKFISEIQKLFYVFKYHFDKDLNIINTKCLQLVKKVLLNKFYGKVEPQLNKFGVSALFTEILRKFQSDFSRRTFLKPDNKIYTVYSAHDSNIVRLIKNLFSDEFIENQIEQSLNNNEVFDFIIPPYASCFIFELHENDNERDKHYVEIYYNGKLIKENLKNISNEYNGKIPFEEFKKLLETSIDKDYFKIDCSEPKEKHHKDNKVFLDL